MERASPRENLKPNSQNPTTPTHVKRWSRLMHKTILTGAAVITAILCTSPSLADGRSHLLPGQYQAGRTGCSNPTGAGALDFDGKNFNGEKQFCKTTRISKDYYHLNCMDLSAAQLGHYPPTEKEFGSSKDHDQLNLYFKFYNNKTFAISSKKTSLSVNKFYYCGK